MAFRTKRIGHATVEELSQDFMALVDFINSILVVSNTVPNASAGRHGTITISYDGTTMKIHARAGQGQAAVTKSVTLT